MNRHRLRKKIPLLATLAALTLTVAGYVFGLAWIQSQVYDFYRFADLVQPRLIDVTIAGWLLFMFSSIGSFLNVVAWRMPRGEGIGGHSHCPRCANTLLARDNVPVLGWIALGGRCRFCALPISRRYPIVEALLGVTVTVLGISEIYSLSLPAQYVHGHDGPLWSPTVSPELLAILCYHVVAVATSWAFALVRMDGTRLPNRLLVFAALALSIPMIAYPTLMVVPWQTERPTQWMPDGLHSDAIMRLATAFVAAAFYGRILAKGLCPAADLKLDPLGRGTIRLVDLIAMLSIPAIVIGWQSTAGLIVVAAILAFALRPLLAWIPINDGPKGQIDRRGAMESFAFALPIALTLHLVLWRVLWQSSHWPSDRSSRAAIIVAALSVLVIPLFLRDPKSVPSPAPTDSDEALVPSEDDRSTDELPDDRRDQESDDRDHRGDHTPSP